jgi:hypothetical protein
LKPSPRTAADEMPTAVREDFERRQRELLPDRVPIPAEPKARLLAELIHGHPDAHPLAHPDRAGPWFDQRGAEVYLTSAADAVRSWWDLAVKTLIVRNAKNLEALAARLIAVAPLAFLKATLREMEPLVDRPSVADHLEDRIMKAVGAKLANALRRVGSRISIRPAAAAEGDRQQVSGAIPVASQSALRVLATMRRSQWGNAEARTALHIAGDQGYSVHGLSKITGIPRSTLQRFSQGKTTKLRPDKLTALIRTLHPIIRQLVKRLN